MLDDTFHRKWRHPDLENAWHTINTATLSHTHFVSAESDLQEALECSDMPMLLGSTGVGKTRLAETLAMESNARVSQIPHRQAALVVRAPSPRAQSFSWKSLWISVLEQLADPLPEDKVDRLATAAALRSGRPAGLRHSTEDTLRNAVICAARDRGLHTLYVDEAASLLKSGSGRVLRDQLDVLRDLADHGQFKVVLVATPRILANLDASGELLRRTAEVFFRRYSRTGATGNEDYTSFRRTLKSLFELVPTPYRFKPTRTHEGLLHSGSLGGIGHLSKWLRRAIVRCDRLSADGLSWEHFEGASLSDRKLKELCVHAERDDKLIKEWTERTHCRIAHAQPGGTSTEPEPSETLTRIPSGRSKRDSKRVGTPRPRRSPVTVSTVTG